MFVKIKPVCGLKAWMLTLALSLFMVVSPTQAFDENQFYYIVNEHSGQSLDVTGASRDNGANVLQWPYWEGEHQQWQLLLNGDGSHRLINRRSGQALDVSGRSTHENANVLQWPWKSRDNANQSWEIRPAGDGSYSLMALHSQKALQVRDGSTINGASVVQGTYYGAAHQRWQILPIWQEEARPEVPEHLKMRGFATLNGGTTGGEGGIEVTVSTEQDFNRYASSDDPYIIRVQGIIPLSRDMVPVGSNTTVLGMGDNSGFTGGGLQMKRVNNVIVRNLKISFGRDDLIQIYDAHNIWIDHNELWNDRDHHKDYYDGLVDITRGSDYVTVSWNRMRDHFKASLVSASDNHGDEDRGRLKVTYHHNVFENINTRIPSLRFGTGHFYNNQVVNVDFAVNSRMGAQMLVEGNIFDTVNRPISTSRFSREDGFVVERNNRYLNSGDNEITQTGTFDNPPYTYHLDTLDDLPQILQDHAGVGAVP